jgi:hypothetical protein
MFARGIRLMIATTMLVAGVACGTDPIQPTQASFGAAPDQTITSDSGNLTIEVRYSPDPPAIGTDASQLTFRDANGAQLTGLTVGVVPWMPAHGHGTSVDPTVTETAPGTFLATPLYLFMPGSWELRMTINGTVDDTAKAAFEIP